MGICGNIQGHEKNEKNEKITTPRAYGLLHCSVTTVDRKENGSFC